MQGSAFTCVSMLTYNSLCKEEIIQFNMVGLVCATAFIIVRETMQSLAGVQLLATPILKLKNKKKNMVTLMKMFLCSNRNTLEYHIIMLDHR